MNTEHKILSDITVWMKYAKYNPEKQRRETWKELVDRNKEMHLRKFPEHTETIERAYQYVYDKRYFLLCGHFNLVESQSN